MARPPGLTPRPPLPHAERGGYGGGGQKAGGGDWPPYGPPAAQGDGRSMLRPYGLARTYLCQGMVRGDRGVAGRGLRRKPQ